MPSVNLKQTTSTTPQEVWKVLVDFESWPSIFPNLQRVQVINRDKSSVEIQCTDHLGRTWKEKSQHYEENSKLHLVTETDAIHPLRFTDHLWTLETADDKTQLALTRQHSHRIPLVSPLLESLSGRSERRQYCQQALDGVMHRAHERVWSYQQNVQTILSRKGSATISVLPDDEVSSVCKKIFKHRIGAVLVIDGDGVLVGLVSERDVVYQLCQLGSAVLQQPVSKIMTRDLIVCQPDSDLLYVLACMTDNKVRHLPVIDDGELKGVISIGDVVQERLTSLQVESDTLREYIAAREWHRHSMRPLPIADATLTSHLK